MRILLIILLSWLQEMGERVILADFIGAIYSNRLNNENSRFDIQEFDATMLGLLRELHQRGWIYAYLPGHDGHIVPVRLSQGISQATILQITIDGIDAMKNNTPILANVEIRQFGQLLLDVRPAIRRSIVSKHPTSPRKLLDDEARLDQAIERIQKAITGRRGQAAFREDLIVTYGHCLVTGCEVIALLEAAHIQPYCKRGTFDVSNGLLLRADVHTLFDLGLIAINESTKQVIVHPTLTESEYGVYQDQLLRLSSKNQTIPDLQALAAHRERAGL